MDEEYENEVSKENFKDSKISKQTPPTVEYSSRILSLYYMIEDLPISKGLLLFISSISVVSVVLLSQVPSHNKQVFRTSQCEGSPSYLSTRKSFRSGPSLTTTTKSY